MPRMISCLVVCRERRNRVDTLVRFTPLLLDVVFGVDRARLVNLVFSHAFSFAKAHPRGVLASIGACPSSCYKIHHQPKEWRSLQQHSAGRGAAYVDVHDEISSGLMLTIFLSSSVTVSVYL